MAREYHLNRATVRQWRRRDNGQDASHRPHRIHATLSPVQEPVVTLRRTLLLPLDDLLAVTREFIHPEVSRSGLDRCRRRHGVSRLSALIPQPDGEVKPVKTFKDDAPGFVHVDVAVLPEKTAANARDFLRRLIEKAPFTIEKILTDNGKEFTDRFGATGEREPTGRHRFDQGCARHGIEHRLIATRRPMAWWNASTDALPRCSPPVESRVIIPQEGAILCSRPARRCAHSAMS